MQNTSDPRARCSFNIVLGGMKAYCERAHGHPGPCWCDWPESQARLMWTHVKLQMSDVQQMFDAWDTQKG